MQQQSIRQERNLLSRAEEPLWLVVQFVEGSRVFELLTAAEAPLAFGGSVHADVQLDTDVPFAFFLERDTRGVWLVPADPTNELFANRRKVSQRTQIYDCTVVSSKGFAMVLWVRDSIPTLRRLPAANESTTANQRRPLAQTISKTNETRNEYESAHFVSHLVHRQSQLMVATSKGEEVDFDCWCKIGEIQAEKLCADAMDFYDDGPLLHRPDPINSAEILLEDLAEPEQSGARIRGVHRSTPNRFDRPLEKIGRLTAQHPIGATLAALIGTLLFLFFLVGATQLLQNTLHEARFETQTTVSPET